MPSIGFAHKKREKQKPIPCEEANNSLPSSRYQSKKTHTRKTQKRLSLKRQKQAHENATR